MFNVNKLIDILIIFSRERQELSPLRINKLLYFIDKSHLRRYGSFILGDRYHRLQFGPIPSMAYNLVSDFFEPIRIKGGRENPLNEYFVKEKRGEYNVLKLKKDRPLDYLSESEKEVIEKVLDHYKSFPTSRLVNISHEEKTYKNTSPNSEIEIALFLDGLPPQKKEFLLGIIGVDRENTCVCKSLRN